MHCSVKTSLSLLFGSLLSMSLVGAPQNNTDPNAQAVDVLRKAIAEYDRTNHPPKTAASKKSQPPAKPVEPASTEPAQAAPPVKSTAATKIQAPAAAGTATVAPMATPKPELSFAEMEQMYLDGKITAKQFQKYLQDHTAPPVTAALARDTGTPPALPPPVPANAEASTTTPAGQTVLTDVDKKLDDLLRAKAEREKSATNNAAPAGPKTKRQRLDEILKQLVDGKISDEEYKAKREKILAEPN
jgi:hypothetical protein